MSTMPSSSPSEESPTYRKGPLAPNPALWEALGRGAKLRAILEAFYARVFEDPRLAPFFHGVTRERVIDKQYAFLADIFTGERMYFGDRPRNAHHWMVISDELFDYRERLFEAVLRESDLGEAHIEAWLAAQQVFRKQIVKDKPVPRRMGGVEMPLGGWQEDVLQAGALCDNCQRELPVGAAVVFHRRLGTTHCAPCGPGSEP